MKSLESIEFLIPVGVLALCVILIPLVIKFCQKYSLYDPVNARKIHSGDIPRLGGIGIVLSFMVGVIVYGLCFNREDFSRILPLVISGGIIFLFGIIDDLLELKAIVKLIVQLVAVSIVVISGYRFNQILNLQLPVWFSYILTFGWVLGIVNAYNLIDGMDGLCGGLSFISCVTLGLSLILTGDPAGMVCIILAASIMGFLVYNWPPAKIFMGDCGSQFLGFMIAVIPLYSSTPDFEYNKFFIMIVIVSIPMLDTIAAIWRRIRDHRPIMSADKMHLHHKLMNLGFNKYEALISLLGVQILICLAIGMSLYISRSKGTMLLFITYCFVVFMFGAIHYIHRAVLKKHGLYGQPVVDPEQLKG